MRYLPFAKWSRNKPGFFQSVNEFLGGENRRNADPEFRNEPPPQARIAALSVARKARFDRLPGIVRRTVSHEE
jgi:hypothetical protein